MNALPQWVTAPPQSKIGDERALPLLKAAVAAAPADLARTLRLARVLAALDYRCDVLALLAPVVGRADAPAEALQLYGHTASRLERYDVAVPALRRAVEQDATARGKLSAALRRAGKADEALDVALAALVRDPDERTALNTAARVLLDRGEFGRLGGLCRDLRQRGGRNAYVQAYAAIAAAAIGDPLVDGLIDRHNWFDCTHDVADAAFNNALANEILPHVALMRSPEAKATRGDGVRVQHLENAGGPLAQALLSRVRARVDAYVRHRLAHMDAPLIQAMPRKISLTAWSLVLRHDGEELWHIHPGAWLSGVYYVSVPPAGPPPAGHIGFGPLRVPAQSDLADFPRWTIAPRSGDLLLFPSWFGHRTWPTRAEVPRISVAFDVVSAA